MPEYLHIVSLDVPFPVDYGGVIDIYYRIIALAENGVKIILHCFYKNRKPTKELEALCAEVHYYPRKKTWKPFLPYIVTSRMDKRLLSNLEKDNHPILFEGVHTTYWLEKGKLNNRRIGVRLHNVEHAYYHQLAKATNKFSVKLYFLIENKLLKKYEKTLAKKGVHFFAISEDVRQHYIHLGASDVTTIPSFIAPTKISSQLGRGNYVLYHGNLSVPENEKMAKNIILEKLVPDCYQLIIAGKNPSRSLMNLCKNRHIRIVANPGDEEMQALISEAHVHLLPSLNNTGTKLKIVNALMCGRFVVTNQNAVPGDKILSAMCIIAESGSDVQKQISELMITDFTSEDLKNRMHLQEYFSNNKNAVKMKNLLS